MPHAGFDDSPSLVGLPVLSASSARWVLPRIGGQRSQRENRGLSPPDSALAMLACFQHLAMRSWQSCLSQLSCTCGPTLAACEQLRAGSDLQCCAAFDCDLVREVSLSASKAPLSA